MSEGVEGVLGDQWDLGEDGAFSFSSLSFSSSDRPCLAFSA